MLQSLSLSASIILMKSWNSERKEWRLWLGKERKSLPQKGCGVWLSPKKKNMATHNRNLIESGWSAHSNKWSLFLDRSFSWKVRSANEASGVQRSCGVKFRERTTVVVFFLSRIIVAWCFLILVCASEKRQRSHQMILDLWISVINFIRNLCKCWLWSVFCWSLVWSTGRASWTLTVRVMLFPSCTLWYRTACSTSNDVSLWPRIKNASSRITSTVLPNWEEWPSESYTSPPGAWRFFCWNVHLR